MSARGPGSPVRLTPLPGQAGRARAPGLPGGAEPHGAVLAAPRGWGVLGPSGCAGPGKLPRSAEMGRCGRPPAQSFVRCQFGAERSPGCSPGLSAVAVSVSGALPSVPDKPCVLLGSSAVCSEMRYLGPNRS